MTSEALAWIITAYAVGCDCEPNHPTRAGTMPVIGFTIAADPKVLPIGSIVEIEGLGQRMVHDTGGKVRGRHIDLFVGTCREAKEWGRRYKRVYVRHIGGSK